MDSTQEVDFVQRKSNILNQQNLHNIISDGVKTSRRRILKKYNITKGDIFILTFVTSLVLYRHWPWHPLVESFLINKVSL
jgi:hypothetical protein